MLSFVFVYCYSNIEGGWSLLLLLERKMRKKGRQSDQSHMPGGPGGMGSGLGEDGRGEQETVRTLYCVLLSSLFLRRPSRAWYIFFLFVCCAAL